MNPSKSPGFSTRAENPEWWDAASAELVRLIDAKRKRPPPGQPDWQFRSHWCDELMRDGRNLSIVGTDMGLQRLVTIERGNIPWWPFDWVREPTMRERLEMDWKRPKKDKEDDKPAATGLHKGEWTPQALARLDAADAAHQACEDARLAERRASPVHVLTHGDLRNLILLDMWDLQWTTSMGGAFGHGIVSLAAWRWNMKPGKTMARIARICGYRTFPRGP